MMQPGKVREVAVTQAAVSEVGVNVKHETYMAADWEERSLRKPWSYHSIMLRAGKGPCTAPVGSQYRHMGSSAPCAADKHACLSLRCALST